MMVPRRKAILNYKDRHDVYDGSEMIVYPEV
jgi:hypothetical protein